MGEANGYRVQKFAELTGVTVRALHHYDRLGLLRPQRNRSGFRIYRESDIARLEQIVALKFLGLPLRAMSALLTEDALLLAEALRAQKNALEEKKKRLERTIAVLQAAEAEFRHGKTSALRRVIKEIEMHSNSDWMLPYFRPEVQPKLQARWAGLTPERQAAMEQDAQALLNETRDAQAADPASPLVQALVSRWEALIRNLVGGDQELVHGVKAMYADRENWPLEWRAKWERFLDAQVLQFIQSGVAARAQTGLPRSSI